MSLYSSERWPPLETQQVKTDPGHITLLLQYTVGDTVKGFLTLIENEPSIFPMASVFNGKVFCPTLLSLSALRTTPAARLTYWKPKVINVIINNSAKTLNTTQNTEPLTLDNYMLVSILNVAHLLNKLAILLKIEKENEAMNKKKLLFGTFITEH